MKKRLFILSFLITSLLTSCVQEPTFFEKPFFSFGTIFNINAYQDDYSKILKGESLINKFNEYFDSFSSYPGINNVYTINSTNEEVKVDEELFNALELAASFYEDTNGYFNPYLGELTVAYKEALTKYNETKKLELPTAEFVSSCLQNIDEFELILNKEKKTVQRKGKAQIDLGAFGKGYAINALKQKFKEIGVQYYFVNGGNSSTYFTTKYNGNGYKASIKYLKNKYINIKESSLGISSVFEQLVEVDGIKYSHIVNPFNGSNLSPYDFSMVKHENPILTDVFSTVLMICEDENMIKEFSNKFGFDYLIYKDNNEVYSSKTIELNDF